MEEIMSRSSLLPIMAALSLVALTACGDEITQPSVSEAPEATTVELAAAAENRWMTRADYPGDIWDATSAAIVNRSTGKTMLYVIGGQPKRFGGPGAITSTVRMYDVSGNLWRVRAPYPVRIASTNGAVVIGGKIYVSGGMTRRWDEAAGVYRSQILPSLYVYNPGTNTWSKRADMPVASIRGVSATYGGMLYVATGSRLYRYSPSTDQWASLGMTPHDVDYGAGGFIGGKFYLVENLGNALDVYDPATNSWSAGPSRPFRICSPAYTASQAKLYLVGCHDDHDFSGNYPMLVFDPKAGSWTQAAAPPVNADRRWTLSRVVLNGQARLELVGGSRPGNNHQYIP
jgi:N-acetylneuraminic acid mutarotase